MAFCSLVVPGLPSLIGTATPTFGFSKAAHSSDFFGVQMTYMHGTSTCFGSKPTFTPVISNVAADYTRTCQYMVSSAYTGLVCTSAAISGFPSVGELTISNYDTGMLGIQVPVVNALPYTVTFGASPAAATVTSTSTVTESKHYTVTGAAVPLATATVTSVSATKTQTNFVTNFVPTTSTVTVCPTPGGGMAALPGVPIAVPSVLSSPLAVTSALAAPLPAVSSILSDPIAVVTPVVSDVVAVTSVLSDPVGAVTSIVSDPLPAVTSLVDVPIVDPLPAVTSILSDPIAVVTPVVSDVVAVTSILSDPLGVVTSLLPSVPPVSLPVSLPVSSIPVLTSLPTVISTPSAVTLPTTLPSTSTSVVYCPASDGKTYTTSKGVFKIECFVDRFDYDIGIATNNPTTFEQCLQACAANSLCQAVSFLPNGPCYLKWGAGKPYSNSDVWGARLTDAQGPFVTASPVMTSALPTVSPPVVSSVLPTTPLPVVSSVSSSLIIPTTSRTTSAAVPTGTGVSCPASNGLLATVSGRQYLVSCGIDWYDSDLPNPLAPTYPNSYEGCLADCSSTPSCAAVSYVKGGPCYLKTSSEQGYRTDNNIIGGKLVRILPTSTAPASGATVTVTTTISNAAYQCACTPAAFPQSASGACPADDGKTYTTTCGATYQVECGQDRYGNDLPHGFLYADNYQKCLEACDATAGCVDVSWVEPIPGNRGPCYMKGVVGAVRNTKEVTGGRKISGCVNLRLRRKRVVHGDPEKHLAKRAGVGVSPDFAFVQTTNTVTHTSTSTIASFSTRTPSLGTATSTVYVLATAAVVSTKAVPQAVTKTVSLSSCPATAIGDDLLGPVSSVL